MTLAYHLLPEIRRGKLRSLLREGRGLRIMEAHNGLSAIVASTAHVETLDLGRVEFDGLWESSLTDSASKGYPDVDVVGIESRLDTIKQILDVTTKPLIVDGDTGGEALHFEYLCKRLEALGVSAVIIEDKQFPKRNSLEKGAIQVLESPHVFASKIRRGREIRLCDDLMIIARIESLIANRGLFDALRRARIYLEAGADGIMIHSNQSAPDEIFTFLERYEELCLDLGYRRPVVCVPTTYNSVFEDELFRRGASIVIHANHQLRAAHYYMRQVCETILKSGRSFEADAICSPVKDVFRTVGFFDAKEKDDRYERSPVSAVILAAGQPGAAFLEDFGAIPVSMLDLSGKTIAQRQVDALRGGGISKITLVSGYGGEQIRCSDAQVVRNEAFATTKSLRSLLAARDAFKDGFLFVNGDILFDERLVRDLLAVEKDIVLVIDNSIRYHEKKRTKPSIDLVIARDARSSPRRLHVPVTEIKAIGNKISPDLATHEFIGMALFSGRGAEILEKVLSSLEREAGERRLHEAASLQEADINDVVQEIIDRGYAVAALEVNSGWIEVQCGEDRRVAVEMLDEG